MRKYEVDRVHNSKDDEIYQIAQSVEQKVRTGILMPDYEMGQKPFHHWGDIILNYVYPNSFCEPGEADGLKFTSNNYNNWFQSTFSIQEVGNDGNGYVSEIWVDSICMKTYADAVRKRQIISSYYVVEFSHEYNDSVTLEFYNEEDDEWVEIDYNTMAEHKGNFTEHNFKFDGIEDYNICVVRVRGGGNSGGHGIKKIRIRSSVGYLKPRENYVKAYVRFETNREGIDKGIVLSRKKQWIYIECKDLHDICVKHGGMKYVGEREKTIYKITNKNSKKFGKQGLMYYGYSKPRNGRGQNFQPGSRIPRKYRIGWIKCDWLAFGGSNFCLIKDGKSFDEVIKLLCRRHKHGSTREGITPFQVPIFQFNHFIRINKEENCFELWNFVIITSNPMDYSGKTPFIKPTFLKTLPINETWKILEKKFADKIINK